MCASMCVHTQRTGRGCLLGWHVFATLSVCARNRWVVEAQTTSFVEYIFMCVKEDGLLGISRMEKRLMGCRWWWWCGGGGQLNVCVRFKIHTKKQAESRSAYYALDTHTRAWFGQNLEFKDIRRMRRRWVYTYWSIACRIFDEGAIVKAMWGGQMCTATTELNAKKNGKARRSDVGWKRFSGWIAECWDSGIMV